MDLTYDAANKVELTNELIRSLMAMKFLYQEYKQRPESEPFCEELGILRDKYRDNFLALQEIIRKHQRNVGAFGQSSEHTGAYMAASVLKGFHAAFLASPWLVVHSYCRLKILSSDQILQAAQRSQCAFTNRYRTYLKSSMGGAWKIQFHGFWKEWFHGPRIRDIVASQCSHRIMVYSEYQDELLRVCYKYGLRSWWPPLLILEDDFSELSVSRQQKLSKVTPEGMLGLLFPRTIADNLTEIHNLNKSNSQLSDDKYHEWQILGMSGKQKRSTMEPKHARVVDSRMKAIGYENNRKFEPVHFSMLFDRLYLKKSLEDIAAKQHCDDSTVKRCTDPLIELLDVEPPRAPYKSRTKH